MLTIKDCEFCKNTAPPIDALDPIEIMNFTQWNDMVMAYRRRNWYIIIKKFKPCNH